MRSTLILPAHLLKLCDLSTLSIEYGSLLDPDHKVHHIDILYSVSVASEHGEQRGYVYQLIEHQSTPDRSMALATA